MEISFKVKDCSDWWDVYDDGHEWCVVVEGENRYNTHKFRTYYPKNDAPTNWINETTRYYPVKPEKTPEQLLREQEKLLAAERYTHYKTKMEAAKKDMEYWEERL